VTSSGLGPSPLSLKEENTTKSDPLSETLH
jgi:hypothetical protein